MKSTHLAPRSPSSRQLWARSPRPAVLAWLVLAGAGHGMAAAQALDCLIQPHQIVQVGVPAPGVVAQVAVERGDSVRRGQLLVQMQAGVERASLAMAREKASQAGELAAAQGSRELAQREFDRARELYDQRFVSGTYLDKQRAEVEVAGGRTEQARERRQLAQREVELAEAQLALRAVRSPIDGVVVDRYAAPGEYVDDKPVLRVASLHPLRVDVLVPAQAFGQVRPGMKARVMPELLDTTGREAVVRMVDRVIDGASNTFRVRLELPNPDGSLPAGLRCKADLGLQLPAAAGPGGASAAAPAPSPAPVRAAAGGDARTVVATGAPAAVPQGRR